MQRIEIKLISKNNGQIEGVPKNPRQWRKGEVEKLARSIEQTPELFELRPIIVYDNVDGYVAIGGNMRLEAAKLLKWKDVPCEIVSRETTTAKLKEIVIKDNGAFGEWDMDALANEWDDLPLGEWGVPVGDWNSEVADSAEDGGKVDKIDEVEEMLNAAMQRNLQECREQIDHSMKKGWFYSGLTAGMVEARFLRAKYYGERFASWLSVYWCPQRFFTSAKRRSIYEQICKSAQEGKAGISGFRTISEDGNVTTTTTTAGNYPVGDGRLPLDFPSDLAESLIKEFSPNGRAAEVLDPCHGWGGRYVGALLANVSRYVGIDPSEDAHRGLLRCREILSRYADTKSEFIQMPFEDYEAGENCYDIVLTSPPYFDVEQYKGEAQSHVRYNNYALWKESFFSVLIEKSYRALRQNGVFLLQVGSQTYPLEKDGVSIAESVGFKIEEIRPFGRSTQSLNHREAENNEVIIILRK